MGFFQTFSKDMVNIFENMFAKDLANINVC